MQQQESNTRSLIMTLMEVLYMGIDLWSCSTLGTEETHWHIWHDFSRPSTKPWGRGGKTARDFRSGCNYGIKRQLPAEWEEVENSNNFLYCHTVSRNLFTQSLQGSSTSTQLASRSKSHQTARRSRDHFTYGLEIRCNQPEHLLIMFHATAIIHEVQQDSQGRVYLTPKECFCDSCDSFRLILSLDSWEPLRIVTFKWSELPETHQKGFKHRWQQAVLPFKPVLW